jgi:phosphoglycerate dehydrogenase-like enzyme
MEMRTILFLPRKGLAEDILSPRARDILTGIGEVVWNERDRDYTPDELADLLPGADAVITSWGSPALTPELLEVADRLKIVGHAAGSVKHLMPKAGYDRGIVVLSAAAVIAEAVAEYTVGAMLSMQRQLFPYHRHLTEARGWKGEPGLPVTHDLYRKKVGIVAVGMVGRRVIELLKPFHCDVMVYDPYLSDREREWLGVRRVSLDELFATSDVVSLHAPSTEETKAMITARHFRALRDGALFINTARTWVVDREAMLEALQTGRFRAVLDVFYQEPLPADDPLRDLDNVLLTPHISGLTVESRLRLVEAIAEDVRRFFAGEDLVLAVPWDRLKIMA